MTARQTLREIILQDFGIDLPLLGGSGTRDAPYVITATDAQEATDVEAQLMRCLARGRGEAWRWLGQHPAEAGAVVKILRVRFPEQQVVEEQVGYYFTWQLAERHDAVAPLPNTLGFLDARSRVFFPYQLGWVHLTSVTDNERDNPGLGTSVAYGGLGIKATLYTYNHGQPVDSHDSSRIEAEFNNTVSDALSVNESAEVSHVGQFSPSNVQLGHHYAILALPDDVVSAVVLGVLGRYFMKARVTWTGSEERIHQMGHECVIAIVEEVSEARAES